LPAVAVVAARIFVLKYEEREKRKVKEFLFVKFDAFEFGWRGMCVCVRGFVF
jgi:hypothetical protein